MTSLYAGWLLSALGAAIVVVAAWLLYPRGEEPEPWLAAGVALVVMTGLPFFGVLLGLTFSGLDALPPVVRALVLSFAAAAVPEEAFKGLVVWALVFQGRPVRRLQDGVFYGVVAGAAFALLENLAYVFNAEASAGLGEQVAFVRTVMAAPGHACYAAILGHHLALAKRAGGPSRPAGRRLALGGLALAAGLHGSYNAVLMLSEATGEAWLAYLAVPIFMGSAIAAFVCLEQARRADASKHRVEQREVS